MILETAHISEEPNPSKGLFFLFTGQELVFAANNTLITDLSPFHDFVRDILYIGLIKDKPCYVGQIDLPLPSGLTKEHLRTSYHILGEEFFAAARYAFHIGYWHGTTRFCGKCGALTKIHERENAKRCTSCGHVMFPRIAPAVIMAVVRGDKILLARAKTFTRPIFSTLAGFVEPGETLEDCIHREIREEVGIAVKNIRYFGSQPWPFPKSLMVGFTCDHAEGEINLNTDEMVEAGWFDKAHLPPGPDKMSIASRLIDWFVEHH